MRAAILADMHRDHDAMVEDGLEMADEDEKREEEEEEDEEGEKDDEEEDEFQPRRRRRAPLSPVDVTLAPSPPRQRARLVIPSSPDLFDGENAL